MYTLTIAIDEVFYCNHRHVRVGIEGDTCPSLLISGSLNGKLSRLALGASTTTIKGPSEFQLLLERRKTLIALFRDA